MALLGAGIYYIIEIVRQGKRIGIGWAFENIREEKEQQRVKVIKTKRDRHNFWGLTPRLFRFFMHGKNYQNNRLWVSGPTFSVSQFFPRL